MQKVSVPIQRRAPCGFQLLYKPSQRLGVSRRIKAPVDPDYGQGQAVLPDLRHIRSVIPYLPIVKIDILALYLVTKTAGQSFLVRFRDLCQRPAASVSAGTAFRPALAQN